jgi:hypothetical protein
MNPYAEFLLVNEKKKKQKMDDVAFKIPNYDEYNLIFLYNYRVKHLKKICKHYKLKQSGNKPDLLKKIFNFLYLSSKLIPFQSKYRGHLVNRYCNYSGPAWLKRNVCVNDTDFISLDPIDKISFYQLFSYKDENNYIHGFDIKSLNNWILNNKKVATNPYTRNPIPTDIINNMKLFIRISKLLGFPLEIDIAPHEPVQLHASYENRVVNVFQAIDDLGNYTNPDWFLSLTRYQKTRFIRELYDIWFYRLELTNNIRRNICPRGNPFRRFALNLQIDIIAVSEDILNKFILSVIEEFVYYGIADEFKNLGASYILTALTLVNQDVANALPWLYQSVVA